MSKDKGKSTICWKCDKAVPSFDGTRGCSWSLRFEPVDGWEAEATQTFTNAESRVVDSFRVIACPEFEPTQKRGLDIDFHEDGLLRIIEAVLAQWRKEYMTVIRHEAKLQKQKVPHKVDPQIYSLERQLKSDTMRTYLHGIDPEWIIQRLREEVGL